jgi:hypothetical protein
VTAPSEPAQRPTLNPLREPALLVATLLAPAVQTGLLIWGGFSAEGQSVVNAVAAALAGVVVAALSASDRLAPAIVGLATAVLALAAWFGWGLDAEQQTAIVSLVSLGTGLFLRTQITAPVDAAGNRVTGNRTERNVDTREWPYDFYEEGEPDPDHPDADPDADYEPESDTAGLPVVDEAPPPMASTLEFIEGRRMAG